jgi:Primase C terminal 2 (PriCT-2)
MITKCLDAFWRQDGHPRFIATLNRKSRQFHNLPVSDIAEAVKLIGDLSETGHDLYFAPAAYGSGQNRTAANALGAYGFWADLDCGAAKAAAGKGYADIDQARTALDDSAAKTCLPPASLIICSGNGLQAYWLFDSIVLRESWVEHAQKLKAIHAAASLLADPSRTADIASVMRVPDTWNHKQEPAKLVYVIDGPNPPLPRDEFLAAIDRAHAQLCERPAAAKTAVARGPAAVEEAPDPLDIQAIEEMLGQVDPDLPRNDWFRVAAIIFHELNGSPVGFTLFDSWSKLGKKYTGLASTRAVWKSMRPDHPRPATLASLIWMAKEYPAFGSMTPRSGSGDGAAGEAA